MSEPTDNAVNRAAISSMMMPTGILVFRPVRAAIQPLAKQNKNFITVSEMDKFSSSTKYSPCPPASDSNSLKDVNPKLTNVDEEEDKEAE